MAMKPNYKFDKRQRDLAKKKQQEEKLQRKRARSAGAAANAPATQPSDSGTEQPAAKAED